MSSLLLGVTARPPSARQSIQGRCYMCPWFFLSGGILIERLSSLIESDAAHIAPGTSKTCAVVAPIVSRARTDLRVTVCYPALVLRFSARKSDMRQEQRRAVVPERAAVAPFVGPKSVIASANIVMLSRGCRPQVAVSLADRG